MWGKRISKFTVGFMLVVILTAFIPIMQSTVSAAEEGVPASVLAYTSPAAGTYKIGDAIGIAVQFDKPVNVDSSASIPYIQLKFDGGKTVSATYIGMQENFCLLFRYTIRPEDGVMGDLTVTDRIIASAGSIQDNENLEANLSLGNENTLIGTYVDGIAPEVHSMWQDGGPTSSIGAGFSEYIVAGPDINKITAKDNNGNPVQVRVCIDEEQWHLDVFAVDGWKKDMRYWISVPANAVLDRAGNSIANDLTLDWYTGYYTPTVYSSTPPENGNGVVRNPYITLRFTQNINRSWNYNVISVRDKSGIPVLLFSRIDGNLLILKPYYMLKKNTQYTVNIPAKAVIGSYANSPNDAYSFTFTTGS